VQFLTSEEWGTAYIAKVGSCRKSKRRQRAVMRTRKWRISGARLSCHARVNC